MPLHRDHAVVVQLHPLLRLLRPLLRLRHLFVVVAHALRSKFRATLLPRYWRYERQQSGLCGPFLSESESDPMNEDLIDAIDEYNAAVDLRNEPICAAPQMAAAMDTVVENHLKKFERELAKCSELRSH